MKTLLTTLILLLSLSSGASAYLITDYGKKMTSKEEVQVNYCLERTANKAVTLDIKNMNSSEFYKKRFYPLMLATCNNYIKVAVKLEYRFVKKLWRFYPQWFNERYKFYMMRSMQIAKKRFETEQNKLDFIKNN